MEKSGIAVYSRKSKITGTGESIENQFELCRQYIRLHYEDAGERTIYFYEDEGFSGKNFDRPQFQQMMEDGKKKRFSTIICYRLDRISRNIGDFAKLIEELNLLGISFISIREQFDTSLPMGRAMMYIASVFSQLERETIAERIKDNMRELSKTGRWLGGTTPTGYESVCAENLMIDGKRKRACYLQVIPKEEEIVKAIYREFLKTASLKQVGEFLQRNGIETKNGTGNF